MFTVPTDPQQQLVLDPPWHRWNESYYSTMGSSCLFQKSGQTMRMAQLGWYAQHIGYLHAPWLLWAQEAEVQMQGMRRQWNLHPQPSSPSMPGMQNCKETLHWFDMTTQWERQDFSSENRIWRRNQGAKVFPKYMTLCEHFPTPVRSQEIYN